MSESDLMQFLQMLGAEPEQLLAGAKAIGVASVTAFGLVEAWKIGAKKIGRTLLPEVARGTAFLLSILFAFETLTTLGPLAIVGAVALALLASPFWHDMAKFLEPYAGELLRGEPPN